jgi:hypothetical protein
MTRETTPVPVGELYVLRLLQTSSCFKLNDAPATVCAALPCACAQSLLDEIGKPLRTEIERLRAALQKIIKRYETAEDGWPAEDMVAMAKNALDNHNPRWPDPTPEMLASPEFEAVWQCIKGWDIGVPDAYVGYCGPTGNHVRAILDALERKP